MEEEKVTESKDYSSITMEIYFKPDGATGQGLSDLGFDVEQHDSGNTSVYVRTLGTFELLQKVLGDGLLERIEETSIWGKSFSGVVIHLEDIRDIKPVLKTLTIANARLLEEKEYIDKLQKENEEKELKIKELYKEIKRKEQIVYDIVHVIPSKYFPYSSYEEE